MLGVNSDLNATSEGNSDVSAHESYSYNYSAHSMSYVKNNLYVGNNLDHAEEAQASDEFNHANNVSLPKPKNTLNPRIPNSRNVSCMIIHLYCTHFYVFITLYVTLHLQYHFLHFTIYLCCLLTSLGHP
jgi:hypothetical protein